MPTGDAETLKDGRRGGQARPGGTSPSGATRPGSPRRPRSSSRREAIADDQGREPAAHAWRSPGRSDVTRAKLLTLLVEFDPEANDDFSGWEKPDDPSDPDGCVTEPAGTLLSGPLHNELPDPATSAPAGTTTRSGCRTSAPATTTS